VDPRDALEAFKTGEVRFLICTDVAARGIDIKELPYVISTFSLCIAELAPHMHFADYTLPDKPEDYIHRVGRVGRADRMGLAISLVGAGKEKVCDIQDKGS
jgi:ATP-dependent RNA helicase DDX1